jgi:hypothetical protein
MSPAVVGLGTSNLMLELRQERLETEIAVYASRKPQGDEAEEQRLRNTLVSGGMSLKGTYSLKHLQVEFLDDAHNARFTKTRYMRHVARIIGCAIRDEIFVPWEEVHVKAPLKGTASNLSDEEAFLLEEHLLIPQSHPMVPAPRQQKPNTATNSVKVGSPSFPLAIMLKVSGNGSSNPFIVSSRWPSRMSRPMPAQIWCVVNCARTLALNAPGYRRKRLVFSVKSRERFAVKHHCEGHNHARNAMCMQFWDKSQSPTLDPPTDSVSPNMT